VQNKKIRKNEVIQMKKSISVLGCVLFVLVILLPLGTLLSSRFGYVFEIVSISALAFATALISIFLTVLSAEEQEKNLSGIIKVFFALLPLLSLTNAVFLILENSSILVVVCVFICLGCSSFLTIKHGKPLALKITTLVLSALMLLPIGFFGFISLLFGNIGQNTVVKTVKSPNELYYAKVIDSDQGALGGDTLVDVYENKEINALVFKISKKPQRVYHGEWGEFENMDIYWEDDCCLVINSVKYEIEGL